MCACLTIVELKLLHGLVMFQNKMLARYLD